MPYFFVIIALLVVANFYFLFRRNKKSRDVGAKAKAERIATVKRHDDLIRKLDYEQEDAERQVDLRNKMIEMYDQVRKSHESDDDATSESEQKLESPDDLIETESPGDTSEAEDSLEQE